jgi:hypothetical protein
MRALIAVIDDERNVVVAKAVTSVKNVRGIGYKLEE